MSEVLGLTPARAVDVLAGVLVVVHAIQRFSVPKTVAASTTQLRFQWSRFLYVLSSLALFALLRQTLAQPGVLKLLNGGADLSGPAASLPAPLLAALCLSVMLPNIPVVKTIDAKFLDWFQWLGSIPTEVRRLAGELDARRLTVTPADLARIRDFLDADDDLPKDLATFLTDDVADKGRIRLTRILLIYVRLDAMRSDRACAGFFSEFDEDWAALSAEVRRYAADSAHLFRLAARSGPDEEAADRHKKFGIEVYGRLALFLARALLRSGWTPRSIETRIRALGFSAEVVVRSRTPWNLLAQLMVLCLAFFVVVTALLAQVMPASIVPNPGMILFAAVVHVTAVVAAILPKRRWAFARRSHEGERPYPAYLLSALAAAALAAVAAFLFEALGVSMRSVPRGPAGSWSFLENPLIVMSGALALALAYLCDNQPPAGRSELAERAVEGLACGLFLAVVAWCVIVLLPGMSPPDGKWWVGVAISFLIGALLGGFVPGSFRRSPDASAAPAGAPGPLAAATGH